MLYHIVLIYVEILVKTTDSNKQQTESFFNWYNILTSNTLEDLELGIAIMEFMKEDNFIFQALLACWLMELCVLESMYKGFYHVH